MDLVHTPSPASLRPYTQVRATAVGYQTATLSANLDNTVSATVNFALALSPHTISGTVQVPVPLNPINGALVEVLQGQNQFGSAFTDAYGAYSIAGLAPGVLYGQGIGSDISDDSINGHRCPCRADDRRRFLPCQLAGNDNPEPSPTPPAAPHPTAAVDILQGAVVVASTVTDGSGNYYLPGIQPGSYTVRANAATFQGGSQTGAVAATQTTIVNIALIPSPGSVSGIVQNPSAQPIAGDDHYRLAKWIDHCFSGDRKRWLLYHLRPLSRNIHCSGTSATNDSPDLVPRR